MDVIEKILPHISFVLSITLSTISVAYKRHLKDVDIPRVTTTTNTKSKISKILDSIDNIKNPFYSPFITSMWSHGTMQTLIPTLIRNIMAPFLIRHRYDRELLLLDDGGTVGIDWVKNHFNIDDNDSPCVLVHHGLAGNSSSEYITYFVKELLENNYSNIAVMVARGCGDVPLTTTEVFTAAKTSDIRQVIKHINNKFPNKKIYIVGFSLGAGIVLKYVSDYGTEDSIISGSVSICPFWNWNIRNGIEFQFWNYAVLATALKIYYFRNLKKLYISIAGALDLLLAKDCDYFNDVIVSGKELYGYSTRQEYYNDSSPLYISHKIPSSIPTLAICADNDPVCSTIGSPSQFACGSGLGIVKVKKGGHLAFQMTTSTILGYLGLSTKSWADSVATQFITKCHEMNESSMNSPRSVDDLVRHISSSALDKLDVLNDHPVPEELSVIPPDVISAYYNAKYCFHYHPHECFFKPNESSNLLASILSSYRSTCAAFVTAYNPYSTVTNDQVNQHQQNELTSLVSSLKLKYISGYSSDKYGNWKEPSLLVFGCDVNMAYSISKKFNQNAFIWMQLDYDQQVSVIPTLYFTR